MLVVRPSGLNVGGGVFVQQTPGLQVLAGCGAAVASRSAGKEALNQQVVKSLSEHGYTFQRKICKGGYGRIILVRDSAGINRICKIMDLRDAPDPDRERALNESRVLRMLKHPYIVQHQESFMNGEVLFIMLEYCEGNDLAEVIKVHVTQRCRIPEERILRWLLQSLLALRYMHENNILHRDLKPGNIFLTKDGEARIGDFGCSKILATPVEQAMTLMGTFQYMSPEVIGRRPYSFPADVWSMGVILYELLTLSLPFQSEQHILHAPSPVATGAAAFYQCLCVDMLRKEPSARPSVQDILQVPEVKAFSARLAPLTARTGASSIMGQDYAAAPSREGTFNVGDLVRVQRSQGGDSEGVVVKARDRGEVTVEFTGEAGTRYRKDLDLEHLDLLRAASPATHRKSRRSRRKGTDCKQPPSIVIPMPTVQPLVAGLSLGMPAMPVAATPLLFQGAQVPCFVTLV